MEQLVLRDSVTYVVFEINGRSYAPTPLGTNIDDDVHAVCQSFCNRYFSVFHRYHPDSVDHVKTNNRTALVEFIKEMIHSVEDDMSVCTNHPQFEMIAQGIANTYTEFVESNRANATCIDNYVNEHCPTIVYMIEQLADDPRFMLGRRNDENDEGALLAELTELKFLGFAYAEYSIFDNAMHAAHNRVMLELLKPESLPIPAMVVYFTLVNKYLKEEMSAIRASLAKYNTSAVLVPLITTEERLIEVHAIRDGLLRIVESIMCHDDTTPVQQVLADRREFCNLAYRAVIRLNVLLIHMHIRREAEDADHRACDEVGWLLEKFVDTLDSSDFRLNAYRVTIKQAGGRDGWMAAFNDGVLGFMDRLESIDYVFRDDTETDK